MLSIGLARSEGTDGLSLSQIRRSACADAVRAALSRGPARRIPALFIWMNDIEATSRDAYRPMDGTAMSNWLATFTAIRHVLFAIRVAGNRMAGFLRSAASTAPAALYELGIRDRSAKSRHQQVCCGAWPRYAWDHLNLVRVPCDGQQCARHPRAYAAGFATEGRNRSGYLHHRSSTT